MENLTVAGQSIAWTQSVYERNLTKRIFFKWKNSSRTLNPPPLSKAIAVLSAFKWISFSFSSSTSIDDSEQYVFPYHLCKEQDGRISHYFISRVREYACHHLKLSEERFPLFIHAIALLDAFQMMKIFQSWKQLYYWHKTLVQLIRKKRLQKYYRSWLQMTIRIQRLKDTFSLVKSVTRFHCLRKHFHYWTVGLRLLSHLEYRVIPKLFQSSLKRWKNFCDRRHFYRLVERSSVNFNRQEALKRKYQMWTRKLIPLRTPFLALHSSTFHDYLLRFIRHLWQSSLRRRLRLHEQLRNRSRFYSFHSFIRRASESLEVNPEASSSASLKEQELTNRAIEKIRQIIATIQGNLGSSQSQLFLCHLGDLFYRKNRLLQVLKNWQWRLPQLSLDRRDANLSVVFVRNQQSHSEFQRSEESTAAKGQKTSHRRRFVVRSSFKMGPLSRLFLNWKSLAFRKGFLRKCEFIVRSGVRSRLLHRCYGLWMITTFKFQAFSRNFNRIAGKVVKRDLYIAWFAWRNQYERSVLIRNNQTTKLLLRNREIEEYGDYLVSIVSREEQDNFLLSRSRRKRYLLRQWAMYVRDRHKGKRLFSTWFQFSGKATVHYFFQVWKVQFNFVYERCALIQRVWRGFFVRKVLFPRRVSYLRYFKQQSTAVTVFRRRQTLKTGLRVFLQNLLIEKRRQVLQLRDLWKGRFFSKLSFRWKHHRKRRQKVGFFQSFFLLKKRRSHYLRRWKLFLQAKKFQKSFDAFLVRRKLSVSFQFWIMSFLYFRRQKRQVQMLYFPQRCCLSAVERWKRFVRTQQHVKVLRTKTDRFLKFQLLKRWIQHYLKQQSLQAFDLHRNKRRLCFVMMKWLERRRLRRSLTDFSHRIHSFLLRKRYFRGFIVAMRERIRYREEKKPFLVKKYEMDGNRPKSRLSSNQRKMINYLNKKYLFGNLVLSKALSQWRNYNLRYHSFHSLLREKLLLFEKRRLKKYFKLWFLPLKRRYFRPTTASSSSAPLLSSSSFLLRHPDDQRGPTRQSESYYLFLSQQQNLFNRQIRKIRAEKAAKTRLYLLPPPVVLTSRQSRTRGHLSPLYYYFHRLIVLTQSHRRDSRISQQLACKYRLKTLREFLLQRLLIRTLRLTYLRNQLGKSRLRKNRTHFNLFFQNLRLMMRRRRRRFHLLKGFLFQSLPKLKTNLFFQKLKKHAYLRAKKVFTIEKNSEPVIVERRKSLPHEEAEQKKLFDDSHLLPNYQFPEQHYSPSSYQVKVVRELSDPTNLPDVASRFPFQDKKEREEGVTPTPMISKNRRRSSANYSLFYFQRELEQQQQVSTLRCIQKLQKRCKHFLAQLKLNVLYRRQFRKQKGKHLEERWKEYRIVQWKRFRSSIEKFSLQRQIFGLISERQQRKQRKRTLFYWKRFVQLRKQFSLVKKRFCLFPLFQLWLVQTIALLRYKRIIARMERSRFLRCKQEIFEAWKAIVRVSGRLKLSYQLVSERHKRLEKRRRFDEWILIIDQRVLTEKFLTVRSKERWFRLRNVFHIWQQACFCSEMFTWKNARTGFRNWRLLHRSARRQRVAVQQAAVFRYLWQVRSFFDLLRESRQRQKFRQTRTEKMVRKRRRRRLLQFFSQWKEKMIRLTTCELRLRRRFFPHRRLSHHSSSSLTSLQRYHLTKALEFWLRKSRVKNIYRRKKRLSSCFVAWKQHSERQLLLRAAFVQRLATFTRRSSLSLVWRPLFSFYSANKLAMQLQQRLSRRSATTCFRTWKSAASSVQRKRQLLERFIVAMFLLPQRDLCWRAWKVRVFHRERLQQLSLTKETFSLWKKSCLAHRYLYFYRLQQTLQRWRFISAGKEMRRLVMQRRRELLCSLMIRRFNLLFQRLRGSFQLWRAVTLGSLYISDPPAPSLDLASPSEVLSDLVQRRNHSQLLQQMRQSQLGRVLLFGNETPYSEEEKKELNLEINHSTLKIPASLATLAKFDGECRLAVEQFHKNLSRQRSLRHARRRDPMHLQEQILSNQAIPFREKLSFFLRGQQEPSHRSDGEQELEGEEEEEEGAIAVPFTDGSRRRIGLFDDLRFVGIREKR